MSALKNVGKYLFDFNGTGAPKNGASDQIIYLVTVDFFVLVFFGIGRPNQKKGGGGKTCFDLGNQLLL